jgi:hypothetical protein
MEAIMRSDTLVHSAHAFSTTAFSRYWLLPAVILLLVLLFMPLRGIAHSFNFQECEEASDFVKNTAVARDHGVPESILISRISDNIEILRNLPSPLHHFVQDDEDAKRLLAAAVDVFQHPKSAHAHQVDFFHDCVSSEKPITNSNRVAM